jgi:polar amino acid transport system substrate-binding protein
MRTQPSNRARTRATMLSRRAVVAAVVLSSALVVAACGGGADGAGGSGSSGGGTGDSAIPNTDAVLAAVTKDPKLAAELPASISSAGTIKLGSNLQSAPDNFYAADGRTPVGFEVDLAKAMATKLGVTVSYQDMPFGSLITSLQSGRIDMTMAAMNDTKEREQKIDFVDYFRSGITIMVQSGNPDNINGPGDLCGKTVAVDQGTSQESFAHQQGSTCVAAGKQTVTVVATDNDAQNQNQLRTGRVGAILNDLPTAVYVSKTAGKGKYFQVVPGAPINGGPYGIGVNKDDPALAKAVHDALAALLADGTYGKILAAWNVSQGALTQVSVNAGS